jgi:hypothetical protein
VSDFDVNALVGAAVVLLGALGTAVLALGRSPAKRLLAALAGDVERKPDGSCVPKPGGAIDLLVDTVAARVADRIEPSFAAIRSDIATLRAKQASAHEREIDALKREERVERDLGSLKVALVNRIARLEGAAGVPIEMHGDLTPITEMISARRAKQ